ncbi:hypothetical protein KIPB_012582, partial [Kipferlia bialata]
FRKKMESAKRLACLGLDDYVPFLIDQMPRPGCLADVCAGTGILLKHIAAAGSDSVTSLAAVEISEHCLTHLSSLSLSLPLSVVEAGQASPNLTPAHNVCLAVCLSSLHVIPAESRQEYLSSLVSSMPSGGRVVITDFDPSFVSKKTFGPAAYRRVSVETCRTLLEGAGLSVIYSRGAFPTPMWWTVVGEKREG